MTITTVSIKYQVEFTNDKVPDLVDLIYVSVFWQKKRLSLTHQPKCVNIYRNQNYGKHLCFVPVFRNLSQFLPFHLIKFKSYDWRCYQIWGQFFFWPSHSTMYTKPCLAVRYLARPECGPYEDWLPLPLTATDGKRERERESERKMGFGNWRCEQMFCLSHNTDYRIRNHTKE